MALLLTEKQVQSNTDYNGLIRVRSNEIENLVFHVDSMVMICESCLKIYLNGINSTSSQKREIMQSSSTWVPSLKLNEQVTAI